MHSRGARIRTHVHEGRENPAKSAARPLSSFSLSFFLSAYGLNRTTRGNEPEKEERPGRATLARQPRPLRPLTRVTSDIYGLADDFVSGRAQLVRSREEIVALRREREKERERGAIKSWSRGASADGRHRGGRRTDRTVIFVIYPAD